MGGKDSVNHWHLKYMMELAERANPHIRDRDQTVWINILENELDNIRSALSWGISSQNTEHTIRLLAALASAWQICGRIRELEAYFEQVKKVPGFSSYPVAIARILNQLGLEHWILKNYSHARSLLEESRTISLDGGPKCEPNLAETFNCLGLVAIRDDQDYVLAKSFIMSGLEHYLHCEDEWGIGLSYMHLGVAEGHLDHDSEAQGLFEKSLDIFQQAGDRVMSARTYQFYGRLLRK